MLGYLQLAKTRGSSTFEKQYRFSLYCPELSCA
jgi:hypothetical protein